MNESCTFLAQKLQFFYTIYRVLYGPYAHKILYIVQQYFSLRVNRSHDYVPKKYQFNFYMPMSVVNMQLQAAAYT